MKRQWLDIKNIQRVVIVLTSVKVKKKKLSTHFKIQAYDIKTYVITNKAAEETLFLYNTKKAAVFIFIFEITKKYNNCANT